jgi:hypothetical protein
MRFCMNRYYLADHDFAYVNDGFRTLLHESDLQDFMERTFHFEKAHATVDVDSRAPYGVLIRATFPLRGTLGRIDRRVGALYELERLVRASGRRALTAPA